MKRYKKETLICHLRVLVVVPVLMSMLIVLQESEAGTNICCPVLSKRAGSAPRGGSTLTGALWSCVAISVVTRFGSASCVRKCYYVEYAEGLTFPFNHGACLVALCRALPVYPGSHWQIGEWLLTEAWVPQTPNIWGKHVPALFLSLHSALIAQGDGWQDRKSQGSDLCLKSIC